MLSSGLYRQFLCANKRIIGSLQTTHSPPTLVKHALLRSSKVLLHFSTAEAIDRHPFFVERRPIMLQIYTLNMVQLDGIYDSFL